jgi:hypothetical protein
VLRERDGTAEFMPKMPPNHRRWQQRISVTTEKIFKILFWSMSIMP